MYFGKTRDGLKLLLLLCECRVVIPSAGDDKFIAHAPALPARSNIKTGARSCVCAPVNKKWKYKVIAAIRQYMFNMFRFPFYWAQVGRGKQR
jgi:hypothetical protein